MTSIGRNNEEFDSISEIIAGFEAERIHDLANIERKRHIKKQAAKIAKTLGVVAAVPAIVCGAMFAASEIFDEDNCEDNIPTLHGVLSDEGYTDEEILAMSDQEVNAALYEMGVTGQNSDQELNEASRALTMFGACPDSGTEIPVSAPTTLQN